MKTNGLEKKKAGLFCFEREKKIKIKMMQVFETM